jgi:hypothetical protein
MLDWRQRGKGQAGSQLVGEAGESMNDIVAQVKRVADLIGEISSSAHEQTSGIDQINQAISQLDNVTQQNAALVEEAAAAADSLNQGMSHGRGGKCFQAEGTTAKGGLRMSAAGAYCIKEGPKPVV